MTLGLIRHELLLLIRDRRMIVLFGIAALLLVGATWSGARGASAQRDARDAAVARSRAQWDNIGEVNPHSAAHFGTYAFRPVSTLTAIDPGLDPFLGNVLRIEGHVQNEPGFSEASRSGALVRFGRLQPAMILQVLFPLLIVFGAFASVTEDRESGRLRLLLVQGASVGKILAAKAMAWWALSLAVLVGSLAVGQLISGVGTDGAVEPSRLLLLALTYAAWLGIVCLGTVTFSAAARQGRGALAALLLVWIAWVVVLPRIAGGVAGALHPLPTRVAFETAKDDDRRQGLDGHNSEDTRRVALEQRVLAEYGVDKIEDLPINFDGIVMQADEEYGNEVWDRHFGEVTRVLDQQRGVLRLAGWVDPLLAVRRLSSSLAGTGIDQSRSFQSQAESFRRELIERLNHEHAYGGSRTEDWSWTADAEFYRGLDNFEYQPPALKEVAIGGALDWAVIGTWLFGLVAAIAVFSRRMQFA